MRFPLALLAVLALIAAPTAAQSPQAVCPDGYAALASDDPDAAIPAFEACLADQFYDWPVEAELRTRLGAAHLALGQGEAALIVYNQVFALVQTNRGDADHPLLRRNRAAAFLQLNRFDDALADLEIALRRRPEDGFTNLLAGSTYLELDRGAEAVAAFDAAVRAEPDYAAAWIGRSAAFIELDMSEAAIADAQEAVSLEPEDAGALNALCWALVQAGRAADGLEICEAAVAADPESGAITHSLAAALEQIGRIEEARTLYARAFDLAPDDKEVAADYNRVHGG